MICDNIDKAVKEIEQLMMYRGEAPEEGQLRYIIEDLVISLITEIERK